MQYVRRALFNKDDAGSYGKVTWYLLGNKSWNNQEMILQNVAREGMTGMRFFVSIVGQD